MASAKSRSPAIKELHSQDIFKFSPRNVFFFLDYPDIVEVLDHSKARC